jgi:hypothetical protein
MKATKEELVAQKLVEVSYVIKEQVERFISKHPSLKQIVVGSKNLTDFYDPDFCKLNNIPFTGLLKDVYQYLTGDVLEVIMQDGLTVLVYTKRNEFIDSCIACATRNLKSIY